MEGIIHYRLLGEHPAASGKQLTLPFPGETVLVSKIVMDAIEEHRINEHLYKLELELTRSSSGPVSTDKKLLSLHDVLRNYDCVDIRVTQRHFSDAAPSSSAVNPPYTALPTPFVHTPTDLEPGVASPPSHSALKRGEAETTDFFQRLTAVNQKELPLRLKPLRNTSGEGLGRPDICVLCDLPILDPVRLGCCQFDVCQRCKNCGECAVATDECVVCGCNTASITEPAAVATHDGAAVHQRKMIKTEVTGLSPGFHSSQNSVMKGAERCVAPPDVLRREKEVEDFALALRDGLDHSLAMVDAPDPVSDEEKARRHCSTALMALSARGREKKQL